MLKRDELGFPSFWQLQMMGWTCLYVLVLVGSIPDFLHRSGAFRDETLVVVFMFLGSCVLRPICGALWRRALPWLAFEIRVFAWSLLVGTLGAFAAELSVLGFRKMDWADLAGNSVQFAVVLFLLVQPVFQHQGMAAIGAGKGTPASGRGRGARGPAQCFALPVESAFSLQFSQRRLDPCFGWRRSRRDPHAGADRGTSEN